MYESMYSVQILTKYLYILSEKKRNEESQQNVSSS